MFIDYDTRCRTVVINDPDKLMEFYQQNKDNIFCGYNSRYYDQWILKGILCGLDAYDINNQLIFEDKNGYQIVPDCPYHLNNFDCMFDKLKGLKTIEGFMGSMIKETDVPFDIERELTPEEIDQIVAYCTHDVEQTILVYENTAEEFDSQLSLIEAFDLDMEMFNKTKAQLAATILGAKRRPDRGDEFNISIPDTLMIGEKYQYIVDWYKNPTNRNYKRYLDTTVANVPHTFAWGGIHGSVDNLQHNGIILCCDVASLYPAIMLEYNYLSRNVPNPEIFREIRDTRLILKKKKDPMQLPYKIVLNSTFGASKDKHNPLFDPLMANNICIAGQLLLLDLIEKVEPYCKLAQSNTDGLFLLVNSDKDIETIKYVAAEWEKRTRLDLEWEVYKKIYQKDVNNYILVPDGPLYNENGKALWKAKGAYVKKLKPVDYDLPVVNKAVTQYLLTGKPIREYIMECDNLIEFQKIVKISRLYEYGTHGEERLKEKVLRVYASTDENSQGVFKVKTGGNPEKIANTPEKCFIWNDSVVGLKVPEYLDKEYYVDLAEKRLDDFLNPDKKKASKNKSDIKGINKDLKFLIDELNLDEYESYVDLLAMFRENSICSSAQSKVLTILNYFSKFGGNKKLLQVWDEFYNGKMKYVKTHKDATKEKRIEYLKQIEYELDDEILPLQEQMEHESNLLGYLSIGFDIGKRYMYVMNVDTKYSPRIEVYCLSNESYDKIKVLKIPKGVFNVLPIKAGDVIYGREFTRKPRSRPDPSGAKKPNGKPVFIKDFDHMEWWLNSYTIQKDVDSIIRV